MATKKNIQFHVAETWIMPFGLHNADNSVLDLTGASVQFRLVLGATVLFDKAIGTGIEITSLANGQGKITITPAEQIAAGIVKGKTYKYELRATTPDFVTIQCEGEFKTLPSLFG